MTMRVMRFAAGLAVGYVLGSRAGREKYEQIVAAVDKARSHPVAADAQETTKDPVGADPVSLTSKPATQASDDEPTAPAAEASPVVEASPAVTAVPRPPRKRTKSTLTAPSVTDVQ
jgi:hypothetical protein